MATLSYLIRSEGNNKSIYVQFSIDRKNVFKRKTNYFINSKDWNKGKGQPHLRDEILKKLKFDLDKLRLNIEQRYNTAITDGIEVTAYWLEEQINDIQNKPKEGEPDRLINHFQIYIDNLPHKFNGKGKRVAESTITKYKTMRKKMVELEKYRKKKIRIKDVGLDFRIELIKFFKNVLKLSPNTTGRYITFIKTICLDARIHGIETHPQLDAFEGFEEEAVKHFLNHDELKIISEFEFKREALENARDWLIIGCHTGQRVGDVLGFTKKKIITKKGNEYLDFIQDKTKKQMVIPIIKEVKDILNKRKGNFPRKISSQTFNDHLKDVAMEAGLTEVVYGGKEKTFIVGGEKERRKVLGHYPKWELVTSHIMRRSFATNFYGIIDTHIMKDMTGHSTEAQYLEYVGKPPIEKAELAANAFKNIEKK